MADITAFQNGDVDNSGKVNWRGDQVAAPQGGQSIYKSSSVPLTELGSRKVVGDRVFRYAKAGAAIGAGDLAQHNAASVLLVTGGGTDAADSFTFTWYSATAVAKDYWAEGSIIAQSGTAVNLGHQYRIKSHPAIATTANGVITLYDPLVKAENATDKYSIFQNPYANVIENVDAAATAAPAGVAPIAVTTNDYFWLQTWGPVTVKNSAVAAAGRALAPGITGQVQDAVVATTASAAVQIGYSLQAMTASQYGLAFLTIAP